MGKGILAMGQFGKIITDLKVILKGLEGLTTDIEVSCVCAEGPERIPEDLLPYSGSAKAAQFFVHNSPLD